jgi:3-oxocholest-4-en-26-oyl-CoA dehydrogenase alpha subunit
VHLDYTPEQESLRKELREYFAGLLGDDAQSVGHPGEGNPRFRAVVRQMGTDGWLGIGWPKEYGGQGRSAVEQFIFFDEVQRAGAPFPFVTLNTVGPTIMRYGTDEQKEWFLPRILTGEINFAIG